jgi:hypothetical protein
MADRSTQLLLDGLSRAAADPSGLPLHAGKDAAGLFAATAAGKQAAQRGKDEGLLRVVRTQTRGKTAVEFCTITEKGLAYLLGQVSPRQVLEDFLRALETRHAQAGELIAVARQMQAGLDALRGTAEHVLQQLDRPAPLPVPHTTNGSLTWLAAVLSHLAQRQAAGAAQDCPLPELYQQARQVSPQLTIGHFHDGLRQLHAQGQIYLHPWTGPLHDLPEPACALLVGHEIAYYASLKEMTR